MVTRSTKSMALARQRTTAASPSSVTTSAESAAGQLPMRQQVLLVAADFYVLRGYDGFSFAHIAEAVQTTRANIHHHFGDKLQLMAELIERFASNAEQRIAHYWIDVDGSFAGATGALDLDITQASYFTALVAANSGLSLAQFGVY